MIFFRMGNNKLKWIREISYLEYLEWIIECFFIKKKILFFCNIVRIFYYSIIKYVKLEINYIKKFFNGFILFNMVIVN